MPGQRWQREITKAVRGSDVVIVCLSRGSVTKEGYVQKEIKFALDSAEEKLDDIIFLIPLKLESCDIPERLSEWHWVNFFDERGYEHLLRSLRRRAKQLGLIESAAPGAGTAPGAKGEEAGGELGAAVHDAERREAIDGKEAQPGQDARGSETLNDDILDLGLLYAGVFFFPPIELDLQIDSTVSDPQQTEVGKEHPGTSGETPKAARKESAQEKAKPARADNFPVAVDEEERRYHNEARRFARLLVSEIKLYNEQKVREGREAADLYDRLREDINRSRQMYDKRVRPEVSSRYDYFHHELIGMLAEGDPAKLGESYSATLKGSEGS